MFVSPALKNNFDLQAATMLPPGYRTYEFGADGSIVGDVQLVDDSRWPRHPIGRAVMSLMRGELTWQQFRRHRCSQESPPMTQPTDQTPGVLTGIRVVEFAQNAAIPHCGRLLAGLGADVVKVETA